MPSKAIAGRPGFRAPSRSRSRTVEDGARLARRARRRCRARCGSAVVPGNEIVRAVESDPSSPAVLRGRDRDPGPIENGPPLGHPGPEMSSSPERSRSRQRGIHSVEGDRRLSSAIGAVEIGIPPGSRTIPARVTRAPRSRAVPVLESLPRDEVVRAVERQRWLALAAGGSRDRNPGRVEDVPGRVHARPIDVVAARVFPDDQVVRAIEATEAST